MGCIVCRPSMSSYPTRNLQIRTHSQPGEPVDTIQSLRRKSSLQSCAKVPVQYIQYATNGKRNIHVYHTDGPSANRSSPQSDVPVPSLMSMYKIYKNLYIYLDIYNTEGPPVKRSSPQSDVEVPSQTSKSPVRRQYAEYTKFTKYVHISTRPSNPH